jgi:hypothetical protein
MLLQQRTLHGLRDGSITLAFRRWRRPTVRSGGTLLTAAGELEIVAVSRTALDDISPEDARRAGFASLADLHAFLNERSEGEIYRIEFGALRADPRVALREDANLPAPERQSLTIRLGRLDAGAAEPWTRRTLAAIRARPGVRARDLCRELGQEREVFKANVRKLKALGLTQSLEVGYRLSPRGAAFFEGE